MTTTIRNLDYIRTHDVRLYEALSDIIQQHSNLTEQSNGNSQGQPLPPPSIDAVSVTGQNGHFHVQIQHRAEIYRGIKYFTEFADNPGFSNPHTIHMGDSREHTQFLGNGTYYWRAYAAYASSPPSAPAYFGSANNPRAVFGGGSIGGPALLPSQGSGTGAAGEGLSGPGPIAFRSATGQPPTRGKSNPAAGGGSSPGAPLPPGPQTGLPAGMTSLPSGGGGTTAVSESLIAQSEWLVGVAGTNTITATTAIPYQALAVGFSVRLVPVITNTGATTLNVNGIGAAAVTTNGTTALIGGELQANQAYLLLWDGTRWQIIGISLPLGTTTTVLHGNAGGAPAYGAVVLTTDVSGILPVANGGSLSGTYTPTLYSVANISASTAFVTGYFRVGNTVTVFGRVLITATGTGQAQLGISLPIASALASAADAGGVGFDPGVAGVGFCVVADAANARCEFDWVVVAGGLLSQDYHFTFSYQVK